jgi:hypothetical protein
MSETGLLGFWKTTQQHTYTKPTSTRKSAYSTYSQHLLETDAYRTTIPKPNANMDGSGFRKLPLELKTMVYELSFGHDLFDISLAPLGVYREMRDEANQALNKMRKSIVVTTKNMSGKAWAALDLAECQALVQRIGTVPQHLVTNRLAVQLQHECSLLLDLSKPGYTSITEADFATRTRQLIAAVHPCDVELSVNFTFHAMGVYSTTTSYHNAKCTYLFTVCSRDEPMDSRACEQMLVKVSLLDKTRAQKAVDDAFAEKRRQFEVHRTHLVCFVRASGIDKGALEALAVAHPKMNDMVALL